METLSLNYNRIGDTGCQALSTLLEDPSCNIQTLNLLHNQINNEGINNLVNSLSNNIKLKELKLGGNQMDNENEVKEAFVKLLCNTTSINATYSSNHTLTKLPLPNFHMGNQLVVLLKLNKGTNKKYVAMIKILKYHPNIDMEQLFEWGPNDEKNLMALPYVVAWFDRAEEAAEMTRDYLGEREAYNTKERKLSAIYQFALAMPLMFIPSSHTNGSGRVLRRSKRKRVGS